MTTVSREEIAMRLEICAAAAKPSADDGTYLNMSARQLLEEAAAALRSQAGSAKDAISEYALPPGMDAEDAVKAAWAIIATPDTEQRRDGAKPVAWLVYSPDGRKEFVQFEKQAQWAAERGSITKPLYALPQSQSEASSGASSPPLNDGWQDIETKPRDHFPVLVCAPDHATCVAFLDVTWHWWPVPATEPLEWTPTRWMPLMKRPTFPREESHG